MNELSRLIYLADVAGSAGGWLVLFGGLFFFFLCIATIVFFACLFQENNERDKAEWLWRIFMFDAAFALLTLLCVGGSIAIPSKETVYAIAASEMGEEVAKTPTAQKAVKAVEAWLDKQIASNTPPVQAEQAD